jgi:hypothetical protein
LPPIIGSLSILFATLAIVERSPLPGGVSTGQLLRLTAFNPSPARAAHARFTIFSPDGTPVRSAGPVQVGPLQTVSFDLSGDDRALDAFREASGRAQLSIRVDVPGHRGAPVPPQGMPQDPVLVTGAEVVEHATGRTSATITMKGSKILQS